MARASQRNSGDCVAFAAFVFARTHRDGDDAGELRRTRARTFDFDRRGDGHAIVGRTRRAAALDRRERDWRGRGRVSVGLTREKNKKIMGLDKTLAISLAREYDLATRVLPFCLSRQPRD